MLFMALRGKFVCNLHAFDSSRQRRSAFEFRRTAVLASGSPGIAEQQLL